MLLPHLLLLPLAVRVTDAAITWSNTSVAPFDCETYNGLLQILRPSGGGSRRLAQLNLATGEYDLVYEMDGLAGLENANAAGMLYDEASGESYPLMAVNPGQRLCRFDDASMVCHDGRLEGSYPYVGAVVGTTYVYIAGFGSRTNRMYTVRDVETDSPVFDRVGYLAPSTVGTSADFTTLKQSACPGGCVRTDSSLVANATYFLVAVTSDGRGALLVATDADGTPFRSLQIEPLNIIDATGALVSADASGIGGTGACYTLYAPDDGGARVFCSSNRGVGLFELSGPYVDPLSPDPFVLDVSFCGDRWSPVVRGDEDAPPAGASQVCTRGETQTKPFLTFTIDSEATNNNDGLNCKNAVVDVNRTTLSNDTLGALEEQAAATEDPTRRPTFAPSPRPTTSRPTMTPTTAAPTMTPTSFSPTAEPTRRPTLTPTSSSPTAAPTRRPSMTPTSSSPTAAPTWPPTTRVPTARPTTQSPSTTSDAAEREATQSPSTSDVSSSSSPTARPTTQSPSTTSDVAGREATPSPSTTSDAIGGVASSPPPTPRATSLRASSRTASGKRHVCSCLLDEDATRRRRATTRKTGVLKN